MLPLREVYSTIFRPQNLDVASATLVYIATRLFSTTSSLGKISLRNIYAFLWVVKRKFMFEKLKNVSRHSLGAIKELYFVSYCWLFAPSTLATRIPRQRTKFMWELEKMEMAVWLAGFSYENLCKLKYIRPELDFYWTQSINLRGRKK